MNFLNALRWSPYVAGVGIGVLSWVSFYYSDKPIACSTTFAKASGMIERLLRGDQVENKPYYQKIGLNIDWQWMLVMGIILGSFLSAQLSGDFRLQWVPSTWENTFGASPFIRMWGSMIGGVLLGYGARWADGCTSGHGISGTLQLTVSSWVSAISFFLGGIFVAHILFNNIGM